jgi:hypothetical protein
LDLEFWNFWSLWWGSKSVLDFINNSVEFLFDSLGFLFNVLFEVVNLFTSKLFDGEVIIVDFVFDVRSHGHESFINWSEWARWVCWPGGSSGINNMVDLLLNAFVRNFFLGIKWDIKSELLGINLSSII